MYTFPPAHLCRSLGPAQQAPQSKLDSSKSCATGGVGPTIMETSYLLAGTPVIAYADGKKVEAKPISQPLTIDFGKGLGRKTVWLYNLPEVESAFKYMKVPNVSARFGTDPGEIKHMLLGFALPVSCVACISQC